MQTILGALLPSGASTAESFGDLPNGVLWPQERSAIERAVEKRRLEFSAGRGLARTALERLGTPAAPIPVGPRREPTWPPGIVGSITHCPGYCAAAVAHATLVSALGIDAEPDAPLPKDVMPSILTPDEQTWTRDQQRAKPDRGRLLFSAKESVFKAWFPLTGLWLGFLDAQISFYEGSSVFRVQLLADYGSAAGSRIEQSEGRYILHDGIIITAVAVPADFQNSYGNTALTPVVRSPLRRPVL